MSASEPRSACENAADRLTAIVDDFIDRRGAGEQLSDEEFIARHPELMPELAERLRALARVEEAARRAECVTESPTITRAAGGGPRVVAGAPGGFPGYRIVGEISRGGQGVVYRALQEGTRRWVAIKVLIGGAHADADARRRFEREIELVAQLAHPNIVSVFHSGSTDEGQPFLVMDLIEGAALHTYVRRERLSLRKTVALFQTVCEAVQHAHEKGVIHRDLKPSNILVDDAGQPRVLDFGLARLMIPATDAEWTLNDQLVGTLPYMAPEQTQGRREAVDTRSDVYALGVMLYELLTGRHPYPVSGSFGEIMRHIVESPPAPLSAAWSAELGVAGEPAPSGRALSWRTGSALLARLARPGRCPIGDEIETIVLKALSKEPQRRYESAGALARDLARYLAHEPIDAKRDSPLYVLRKLVRRHRLAAASLASVLVVLLSALSISLFFQQSALDATRRQLKSATLLASTMRTTEAQLDQVRERLRGETALGWFLAEWRAGHAARCQEILASMSASTRERAAMAFLLDPAQTVEGLLDRVGEAGAGLAYFVAGEREARDGDALAAADFYERALAHARGEWLVAAAQAALREGAADRQRRKASSDEQRSDPGDPRE